MIFGLKLHYDNILFNLYQLKFQFFALMIFLAFSFFPIQLHQAVRVSQYESFEVFGPEPEIELGSTTPPDVKTKICPCHPFGTELVCSSTVFSIYSMEMFFHLAIPNFSGLCMHRPCLYNVLCIDYRAEFNK